jgi:hypothetical protein
MRVSNQLKDVWRIKKEEKRRKEKESLFIAGSNKLATLDPDRQILTATSMSTDSDNLSFVLRGINDVAYEQRPIPEGFFYCQHRCPSLLIIHLVNDDQVLVQVKKTGV